MDKVVAVEWGKDPTGYWYGFDCTTESGETVIGHWGHLRIRLTEDEVAEIRARTMPVARLCELINETRADLEREFTKSAEELDALDRAVAPWSRRFDSWLHPEEWMRDLRKDGSDESLAILAEIEKAAPARIAYMPGESPSVESRLRHHREKVSDIVMYRASYAKMVAAKRAASDYVPMPYGNQVCP